MGLVHLVSELTSLSCTTKDQATLKYNWLSDPLGGITSSSNDFAKKITLNRYDFVLPRKGERPVYCQRPYVPGLASDGSGAKVIYTTCGLMSCPSCGQLWALQRVFETAVHIEAYAKYCGSRPAHGQGSVNYGRSFTLDDIRKIGRKINDRVKKQGVTAGIKLFHPYRILPDVKTALRSIISSSDSSGFWKFLRDDHNIGNIDKINDVLGTDFSSIYDCVSLAPHFHFLCFPGNQKFTGDKDLVLKKEHFNDGNEDIWVLRDAESVVSYLSYLISHVGQLAPDKGTFLRPISPFGELHKLSAEKLVSPDVLAEIRLDVLSVMNQGRDKPLVLDGDTVSYDVPKEKEEKTFIPLSDFRLTSLEAHANTRAFVAGVRRICPENANYIEYLIDLYNSICESPDIPQKFKRLFCNPFDELPDFVLSMASYDPVRIMFEKGLSAPPDTFKLFVYGFDDSCLEMTSYLGDFKNREIPICSGISEASDEEKRLDGIKKSNAPAVDWNRISKFVII